jgi:hypothetical protein
MLITAAWAEAAIANMQAVAMQATASARPRDRLPALSRTTLPSCCRIVYPFLLGWFCLQRQAPFA